MNDDYSEPNEPTDEELRAMTPLNERPTPLTDAFWKAMIESNPPMLGAPEYDFARTLERSLAERTEERDELVERFRKEIKQRQETQKANALIDAKILATRTAERNTALAKLAKCREALSRMIQANGGVAVSPTSEAAYQNAALRFASQTLEETK